MGVDEIDTWECPEVLSKYFTGGWTGFDKDGCPVWLDPFGQIDIKGQVSINLCILLSLSIRGKK